MAGDVFVLEVPLLVVTLYGHADGVMAVLAVDFVDGLGKGGLLLAVHSVEQIALDGFVLADVPHNDTAFLIPETFVVLPLVAEDFHGHGYKLLMVVGGDLQLGGVVDVVLRHVHAETAGVGKDGDGLTNGVLLAELA